MSLASHFECNDDVGFIRGVDPKAARRQLNMSLGLVVVLALTTVGAGMTLKSDTNIADAATTPKLVVQAPTIVHVKQAIQGAVAPKG